MRTSGWAEGAGWVVGDVDVMAMGTHFIVHLHKTFSGKAEGKVKVRRSQGPAPRFVNKS